jgi:hypothetical protein
MTGFNLPPGCNTSDIPGNRPIDVFVDKFVEKYCSEQCLGKNYMKCDGDPFTCPEKVLEKAEKAYIDRYDEPSEPPEDR